jgi:hypothetical protein
MRLSCSQKYLLDVITNDEERIGRCEIDDQLPANAWILTGS